MKKVKASQPIGVFDSGVGGLSVLIELRKLLPRENFIFLADQANVPYGEKSSAELKKITEKVCQFLLQKGAKLIVAACNTATCYAIDSLRGKFPIPLVGTVPAIKPACEKTRTKTIAIISTPATSRSLSVKKLINDYSDGATILNIGCRGLEDEVEKGTIHSAKTEKILLKYIEQIKNSEADYLVLGCTHYPFLKTRIKAILGPNVKIIDSGKAISKRTRELLKEGKILNYANGVGIIKYFTTGNSGQFSKVAAGLLGHKLMAQKVIL